MTKLPRMSLHIGDYRKDTGHLRAAGHGAYLLLIMHYWSTGSLPDDDRQLAAIACMTDREWKQWKPIIKAFFHDGWKHKRVEAEFAEAERKYRNRADAGSKGGNAKAGGKQSSSNATAGLEHTLTLSPTKKDDDVDGARARSLISPEALDLAEALHREMGWEIDDPRCIGSAYTAQKWLTSGWPAELCTMIAKRIAADGRKPNSLSYLEKPIAAALAEQQRPVPVGIVNEPPEVVNVHQHRQGSGGARGGRFDASDFALSELARARDQHGG